MNRSELYEGKKLDKIKAHLKKHKEKYLLGAAVGTGLATPEIIGNHMQNKYEFNLKHYKKTSNPEKFKQANINRWDTARSIRPSTKIKEFFGKKRAYIKDVDSAIKRINS